MYNQTLTSTIIYSDGSFSAPLRNPSPLTFPSIPTQKNFGPILQRRNFGQNFYGGKIWGCMRGHICHIYTPPAQEVSHGFLFPGYPFPRYNPLSSSGKNVGRLPVNLSEKRLVGLPTCGGFCDRSSSFCDLPRVTRHTSQF